MSPIETSESTPLTAVWTMAIKVWGTEVSARRFMSDPHPLLYGRRPIDIVRQSESGCLVVEGILGRLQAGTAI